MIYASIALFNDMLRPFQLSIESVRNHVDRVVLVDGSWDGKPSIDGTREYIQTLAAKTPYVEAFYGDGAWDSEGGKRAFQSNWGEKDDYIFFLDSDEVLMAGGEWIRVAARGGFGKDVQTFEVVVVEGNRTFFRANMFRHGGMNLGGAARLPIVVQHAKLDRNW